MVSVLVNNIGRFFLLILLQSLILDGINLGVYLNIYLYLLFIVLLPFETPGWILLPVCFLMGLSVDISLNTMGLHASAATFAGFLRPFVLRILKPREGYDINSSPGLFSMGFSWFASYCLILVFIHHVWFFFMESFKFSDTFFILLKIFSSLLLNVFLILLAQLLTAKAKNA